MKCDVKIAVEESKGARQNILRYLLVPSRTKYVLDTQPYMSADFPVSREVMEERKKAYRKLTTGAATPEEMLATVLHTKAPGAQVYVHMRFIALPRVNY